MDFTFDEEQEQLRAVARAFLTERAATAPSGDDGRPTYVRQMLEDERGFTDEIWRALSDMGWPGLLVPEGDGGTGMGLLEAVVLAEEMGRLPFPGPWLSSAVAGTLTALALDDHDALARLADGSIRATLALEETGTRDPLDPAGISVTASSTEGRWALSGHKPLVLDGHTADLAYVVARERSGDLATFAVDEPGGQPVPNMDVTRKVARLELDGRTARRVGPAGDQSALLQRVVDDIGVVLCAESVGACERALELAMDYAKARVQFGRPIATFQVIKHKLVDMLHQLELARVATHYAAWASTVDDPSRPTAAAMAKGFVAEAATMITGQSIQVHGGVGFTWDVDCHLLFRRVKANDLLFGRQAWQRQRVADAVLGAG